MSNEQIMTRASMAGCLTARIAENTASQQVDLNQWIFEQIFVPSGATVLELCCGTGAQTRHLLAKVGEGGRVVAVDVSRDALDAVAAAQPPESRRRLQLVQSNLDDLAGALERAGLGGVRFDMVFCAYGLYYSKNATALLALTEGRLTPKGSIVIVGPFGPNNGFLFDFLETRGVEIPAYVRHTSRDFMWQEVIPWASTSFPSVRLRMLRNSVFWKSPASVMAYWQNSTFYEAKCHAAVAAGLEEHFREKQEFVNEKWIMLLEMTR